MLKLTFRTIYGYLFIFSLLALTISLTLQFKFNLEPCPLCVIDRLLVILLSLFFIIALIHNPKQLGQRIYSVIGAGLAVIGIILCARHLWMIHLPAEQAPACSPGFSYLIDTLPLHEALMVILKGSGECAANVATFLGLSLPAWTMGVFIILALGNLLPLLLGFFRYSTWFQWHQE